MGIIEDFLVISRHGIVFQDGPTAISYQPGDVFSAPSNNFSIIDLLSKSLIIHAPPVVNPNENSIVDLDPPPLTGVLNAALVEYPIGEMSWRLLSVGVLVPAMAITSFANGGDVEVSQTISGTPFTATYNHSPNQVFLTDNAGGPLQDVTLTPTSFTRPTSYQKTSYGGSVIFNLAATDTALSTDNKTFQINWLQRIYYGVGPAGQNTGAFITSLSSNIASSRNKTFSVTAGATQKVYFAHRSAYGPATLSVNGFAGGFATVSTTIAVTNAFGFIENYTLYESDNVNLGSLTVVVT